MALGGFHVEPDVVVIGRGQAEHGDVSEYDLPVGGGWSGCCECAAMSLGRFGHLAGTLAGKSPALQPGRRGLQCAVECLDFGPAIESNDVEQVHRSAVEVRPARRSAICDTLHLLQEFSIEFAKEQRVGKRASDSPALFRRLARLLLGKTPQESRDLRSHQTAVLEPTIVRLTLDV